MRKSLTILLTLALLGLTGCSLADKAAEKVAEKAVEKATGISVNEKGDSVTIKGKDGQSVTIDSSSGAKLPDGFPFAVFPGGKVSTGSKMTTNGKVAYVVEITFKGEAAAAADFYEKAMKEKGFNVTNRTETEDENSKSAVLMGETEKDTYWITIEVDAKTKEGKAGFIGGAK